MSHYAVTYPIFHCHKFKVIGLNYNNIISVMTVDDWYNLTNYCLNNGSWLGLKLQQMLFYIRARKLNAFFFCHSIWQAAINHKYCTGCIESFLYFPGSSFLNRIEGNPPEKNKWSCLEKHHIDWLIGRRVEKSHRKWSRACDFYSQYSS